MVYGSSMAGPQPACATEHKAWCDSAPNNWFSIWWDNRDYNRRLFLLNRALVSGISTQSTHTLISWTYLFTLLQLDNLDGWESITYLNSPLAPYATEYWIQHVVSKDILSSIELECQKRSLFHLQSMQYINWIWLYNIDDEWNPTQFWCSSIPFLHCTMPHVLDCKSYWDGCWMALQT